MGSRGFGPETKVRENPRKFFLPSTFCDFKDLHSNERRFVTPDRGKAFDCPTTGPGARSARRGHRPAIPGPSPDPKGGGKIWKFLFSGFPGFQGFASEWKRFAAREEPPLSVGSKAPAREASTSLELYPASRDLSTRISDNQYKSGPAAGSGAIPAPRRNAAWRGAREAAAWRARFCDPILAPTVSSASPSGESSSSSRPPTPLTDATAAGLINT